MTHGESVEALQNGYQAQVTSWLWEGFVGTVTDISNAFGVDCVTLTDTSGTEWRVPLVEADRIS